jgi:VRR-NUC domain
MTAILEMSERQLQDAVLELAKLKGWRVYHAWRSDHSPTGFPDLVCVRVENRGCCGERGRLLAIELKRRNKRPTKEQTDWLLDMAAAGVEVYDVSPAEWRSGLVDTILD